MKTPMMLAHNVPRFHTGEACIFFTLLLITVAVLLFLSQFPNDKN